MTPAMIGLAIGAVVGIANYLALSRLSGRVSKPETVTVLKIVGLLDLVLMPAIGWAIGAYVFEGSV